jgi:hypothetical protein
MDVAGAAMHDAMPGRAQAQTGMTGMQPVQQVPQRLFVIGCRHGLVEQVVGLGGEQHSKVRIPPDFLDDAAIVRLQVVRRASLIERELEAGGAGVEDQQGRAHVRSMR